MQQSLVMTGLADVDGFKIYMQVCVWLDFPPSHWKVLSQRKSPKHG